MFVRVPATEASADPPAPSSPWWRRARRHSTAIDPDALTERMRRDLGFADGPPGPRRGGADPTPPLRFPSW